MILLNAENITKSYNERPLLQSISLAIDQGDKIGVIGVNGTGKSTLLKIIAGAQEAEQGQVTLGRGVRINYLSQNPVFQQEATILQQVLSGVSSLEREAKSILTKLGFTDLEQQVGPLSGGQKKRVALACALVSESEILILDEPTNDIDSPMVNWLENYLTPYKGALLMVTHDRYFLDKVVNHIFAYEENGTLKQYLGGYSDYFALYREEQQHPPKKQGQSAGSSDKPYKPVHEKKLKFTYKEQKEFDEIDAVIAGLEESIAAVQEEINLQSANFTRLQELLEEKESLEGALAEKMDRWVYLNDLNDQIQQQNSKA